MNKSQSGAVSGLLVANIALIVLLLGVGSVLIWALVNYFDQKNNVDQKVNVAVMAAKKEQSETDEAAFIQREKEPYRDFVSPSEVGAINFKYPKTWSVYIGSSDPTDYQAYLQPGIVHAIDDDRPYAVRVSVEAVAYEDALDEFVTPIEEGLMKSKPIIIKEFQGIRLDGKLDEEEKEGSMVMFKLRDKTFKIFTEAPEYRKDFDSIILKTLTFNP